MATLTYDPTPADQPEFNEAEQEALKIGEQAEQEQTQILAGKFKDPEQLEKAYLELQSKLGERNENESDTPRQEVREQDEAPEEVSASVQSLIDASSEWNEKGELSQETIDSLSKMNSEDLLNAYLQVQSEAQAVPDLSEQEVAAVQNSVGGPEAYGALMNWASENVDPTIVQGFDNLINTGDVNMIALAAQGLQTAYQNDNGYEGTTLTGKGAPNKVDVFRSQAEVVAAMQDPRYDKDPAYRNDVFEKLNRSGLDY